MTQTSVIQRHNTCNCSFPLRYPIDSKELPCIYTWPYLAISLHVTGSKREKSMAITGKNLNSRKETASSLQSENANDIQTRKDYYEIALITVGVLRGSTARVLIPAEVKSSGFD
jgi:hypothetical protein